MIVTAFLEAKGFCCWDVKKMNSLCEVKERRNWLLFREPPKRPAWFRASIQAFFGID
jgi:hypothetical protein